ncbi:MAG TPA: hypothetical protein VFT22_15065 [Kofleriaceae bacterium]|nr:hypothetical protein [Kofleriaceae bacterium]
MDVVLIFVARRARAASGLPRDLPGLAPPPIMHGALDATARDAGAGASR